MGFVMHNYELWGLICHSDLQIWTGDLNMYFEIGVS